MLTLVLDALLVGPAAAEVPAAEPLALRLEQEVELFPWGDAPGLRALTVLAALRPRMEELGVAVSDGPDDGPGAGRSWVVQVTAPSGGMVQVQLLRPDGAEFFSRQLPVRHRSPEEAAHTLALIVVEGITPLVPERAQHLAPRRAFEVAPESPPVPTRRAFLLVGTRAAVELLLPRRQVVPGAALVLEQRYEPWLVRLDLAGWQRLRARVADVSVSADQINVSLLAGVILPIGSMELAGAAGPTVRPVFFRASGAHVAFRGRTETTWGVMTQCGVAWRWEMVRLQVLLDASRFLDRHPYLLVDGERRLNMGHTTLALSLAAGIVF